jgi:hypothetical protein
VEGRKITVMAYIVMLYGADYKRQVPLVDLEDDIVIFDSEDEARAAGAANIIGEAYGFEIYKN